MLVLPPDHSMKKMPMLANNSVLCPRFFFERTRYILSKQLHTFKVTLKKQHLFLQNSKL